MTESVPTEDEVGPSLGRTQAGREVELVVVNAVAVASLLAVGWWLLRSPIVRALLRGRGTDPSQFGSWMDHLDDIGLGPSWRSDGSGGVRETRVQSKHTRRR